MAQSLTERLKGGIASSVAVVQSLDSRVDEISDAISLIRKCIQDGGKVMTVGNGGSAAEAMHMSEELVGRFRSNRASLAGICLCADCTALTCIANDFGYDSIFSRQIEGLGRSGDVVVVFSTSGNAANLKLAIDAARQQGCQVLAVLGRDGGNIAGMSDVEVIVDCSDTERIQEAHQVVLHLILDSLEDVCG